MWTARGIEYWSIAIWPMGDSKIDVTGDGPVDIVTDAMAIALFVLVMDHNTIFHDCAHQGGTMNHEPATCSHLVPPWDDRMKFLRTSIQKGCIPNTWSPWWVVSGVRCRWGAKSGTSWGFFSSHGMCSTFPLRPVHKEGLRGSLIYNWWMLMDFRVPCLITRGYCSCLMSELPFLRKLQSHAKPTSWGEHMVRIEKRSKLDKTNYQS